MKYIIVLGDGMADEPISELGSKTPLEYANTPYIDALARQSELGLCHTIPEGMSPGSDTANLSVLGYNPREYYTGRSPLEALSIGVNMKDNDIAIRCNVVTLSEEEVSFEDRKMIDHSSSEITTEESDILIRAVKEAFEDDRYQFYTGTSYRHLTIWNHGEVVELTPPHDILGKAIKEYLPEDSYLKQMIEKSYEILNNHPINIERAKKGLHKANSIWFWGAGTKPSLVDFKEKFGKSGSMISAVDLLKGIAIGANMDVVHVEGADGTLYTNYEGKARAAVKELVDRNQDFVYIHVEAPDEMGHQGHVWNKIKAIEYIDEKIVKIVKEELDREGTPYRMLIMPDHPTPIYCRTHTSNPVPYLLYDSTNPSYDKAEENSLLYNEKDAALGGNIVYHGHEIINKLFSQKQVGGNICLL